MRSDLGAIENRMDHTISNLMNIAEKTADSRSRLEDADFALGISAIGEKPSVTAGRYLNAESSQSDESASDGAFTRLRALAEA